MKRYSIKIVMKDHVNKLVDTYTVEFNENDSVHSAFRKLIEIVQTLFHSRKSSGL